MYLRQSSARSPLRYIIPGADAGNKNQTREDSGELVDSIAADSGPWPLAARLTPAPLSGVPHGPMMSSASDSISVLTIRGKTLKSRSEDDAASPEPRRRYSCSGYRGRVLLPSLGM